MIPKSEKSGNLPKGVHKATLDEVREIFGASSARRKWLIGNLEKIIDLAKSTRRLERVIVWGSFVSNKELPRDIDLLLIMKEDFVIDKVDLEVKKVFDYVQERLHSMQTFFGPNLQLGKRRLICGWRHTK